MNIVLWIIVSVAFIASIIMFIPSIMSIASPKSSVVGRRYYWLDKVSKAFFGLVLFYPLLFLIAVLCSRFFDLEVLPWLSSYVVVSLFLFLIWSKLNQKLRE
ncbi:hypothetical protein SAMN05444275_1077 [Myroides odoratimimus subsp. xuanwuensis]|nr:hypothetical protein SAMN05444275_1077 [Myroides odoratimimus subsp. xuanwuensis]